jgi:hypothetical protein
MIIASLLFGASTTNQASAQQVTGNAPFINSWLVSGPFDSPVVDKQYDCEADDSKPGWSAVADSAETAAENGAAANAVDGDPSTIWHTAYSGGVAPMPHWLDITLTEPHVIDKLTYLPRQGGGTNGNIANYEVSVSNDGVSWGTPIATGTFSAGAEVKTVTFPPVSAKHVRLRALSSQNGQPFTSAAEVNLYGSAGLPSGTYTPVDGKTKITPKVGESLSFGDESAKWEYFDDRIYNRTYDDYQDLYGYYSVKKGVDTRNKYVYAHTYVYSPVERQAYFNVGASGSYRLYVNDSCLTAPSTPVEVQKDLTKQAFQLHAGWNKLMIQIKHTYTEDVNSNGVPIAKDRNVAYLGFYGRVTDQNGNKINDLVNSVAGPSGSLQIVSQGLSTDDAIHTSLPQGNMPTGYKEWPYVWNKSAASNKYGVSASAFQFMAAGGAPGYMWKVVNGKLPDGL